MLTIKRSRRPRVPKPVIITIISIIVLLGLLVAAGVAYVWYTGRYGEKHLVEEVQPKQTKVERKKVEVDPNAPVGASVQSITGVAPGENASITVRTTPEAMCTITVKYNEVTSQDSGLTKKLADEDGMVSWTWTVEDTVPLGKWPAEVTCTHHDKSGMVRGILEVAKPTEEEPAAE